MNEQRTIEIAGMVLLGASLVLPSLAQVAPDATPRGPLGTTSAEYRFPATLDEEISGLPTEIWARVYRPAFLGNPPYPLLVFLHGNHATCGRFNPPSPARIDDNTQYTFYGTCPPTHVVVPNHAGYTYIGDQLASWGYIVVSINANRGINAAPGIFGDSGLNLARGRLVLSHLQRLSEWNTFGGTPASLGVDLQGTLDFNNVGLMGHSRGGEGMRAAYNMYRDPDSPWPARIPDPINFLGIFEIGPVDGQTSRVLNADGAIWNVLLPMCDGDVSNLQGVRPFDRMMSIFNEFPATQKSTFTVWGANHNFYNTEWQQSDSGGCQGHPALFPDPDPMVIGSPRQRTTGLASVAAFFRANVGPNADPAFNRNFNPQFALPAVVTDITRADRGFTDSPNDAITTVFEDFVNAPGISSYGIPNDVMNITFTHGPVPNHDVSLRAGIISWMEAGGHFQTNWTDQGAGADISGYQTLDLRVSRQSSNLNPPTATNFSIRLAHGDGTLSAPVQLNAYTDLVGPVGGLGGNLHPILQTARIPLADFGSADLTQVRGVRLTFDGTPAGAIYVANIRLSVFSGSPPSNVSENELFQTGGTAVNEDHSKDVNTIKALRAIATAPNLQNQPAVEIELNSSREFTVRNELLVLRIAGQEFKLSRYPDSGDLHTVIFTIPVDDFAKATSGEPVKVQYGQSDANAWDFGRLDKSLLK